MLQLAAVPGPSSATEPWQMFTQEVVLTFLVVLCYFVARGQAKAPAVGAAYLATTLTSSVSFNLYFFSLKLKISLIYCNIKNKVLVQTSWKLISLLIIFITSLNNVVNKH
jgi:hypothetical protein